MFFKRYFLLLVSILPGILPLHGQIIDDFSDGDLSSNPVWVGQTGNFVYSVAQKKLKSNGPDATAAYYFSTPNQFIDYTTWEFRVSLAFKPSDNNHIKVYLVSDSEDLSGSLNGYFVRIGEDGANDGINFYKQQGTMATKLAGGAAGKMADNPNVSIRVERDNAGNWKVVADLTGGDNFTDEILTVSDDTFTTTGSFGMALAQSKTNKDKFFLGPVKVSAQLVIVSVKVTGKGAADILLNQAVTEASANTASNYAISEGIAVVSAQRDTSNFSLVHLTFGDLATKKYGLVVSGLVRAQTGELQSANASAEFAYTSVELQSIIATSPTEISLMFNSEPDPTTAEKAALYQINGGIGSPISTRVSDSDPKKVLLTLGKALEEQPYQLTLVGDMPNRAGNSRLEGGSSFDFTFVVPFLVESVVVQSKNVLQVQFNKAPDATTAREQGHYKVATLGEPESVVLANANTVLLTFSGSFEAADYELSITGLTNDASGTIFPNPSVVRFSYLPLYVKALLATDGNKMKVRFNQAVEETTARLVTNYTLNDHFGHPAQVVWSSDSIGQVILIFREKFLNYTYKLTIDGVRNAAGNSMAEMIEWSLPVSTNTDFNSLVINEIFADPAPKKLQPDSTILPTAAEAEFVEIYNPGSHTISISNFGLSGGIISDFHLGPGEYVALVPSAYLAEYQAIGSAVSVNGWNALSNTGEAVTLTDHSGNLINSVSFSARWHDNSEQNGGWSLEKVNPLPVCESDANWRTSTDARGATPGHKNAVFNHAPDTTGPLLISLKVPDEKTVVLQFNENMRRELSTGQNPILEGYEIVGLEFINDQELKLTLGQGLVSERHYLLKPGGLADCSGNAVATAERKFYYDVKPPVLERVVFRSFTALLLVFDESVKESVAEDEANYSITSFAPPAKATLVSAFPGKVLIEFEESFVPNTDYTLTISNLQDTLGNPMVASQSAIVKAGQDIDSVWVEAPNLLAVKFRKVPTSETLGHVENYLINENVHPTKVLPENDKMCRLVFEDNFLENRELTLAVSGLLMTDGSELITPGYSFTRDTKPPVVLSVSALDHRHLQIEFDEDVNKAAAEATGNYLLAGAIAPTHARYSQKNRQVLLSFSGSFPQETELTISILTMKDLYGNKWPRAATKIFVYDTLPPQIEQVRVVSPVEVEIEFSEPVDAAVENPGLYKLAESAPAIVWRLLPDSSRVSLIFSEPIPVADTLVLNADGIVDCRRNISGRVTYLLDNQALKPGKVIILAENKLEVHFNQGLGKEISPYQVELEGHVISEVYRGGEPHILGIVTRDKMVNDSDYVIHFSGLTSASGMPLGKLKEMAFTYRSFLNGVSSNNPVFVNIHCTVPIDREKLARAKIMVTPGNHEVASVLADADNPVLVRAFFIHPLPVNETLHISLSGIYDKWGRQIPHQSVSFSIDMLPPQVDTVYIRGVHDLVVEFVEPVDRATALSANHYSLLPDNIEPVAVVLAGEKPCKVILSFQNDFEAAPLHRLAVGLVQDVAGNTMISDTIDFRFVVLNIPLKGEVLITEIMADPVPSAGLPEVEYVEIYHAGTAPFDLSGILLYNGGKGVSLGEGQLAPGEFLVLSSVADARQTVGMGRVLGLSGWVSLANAGDSLTLVSSQGEVLDRVVYHSSWYGDGGKDEGGYSLELIGGRSLCAEASGWGASSDSQGGTPGRQNSLFYHRIDTIKPELISAKIEEGRRLVLHFSEPLADSLPGFSVEGAAWSSLLTDATRRVLTLTFSTLPEVGKEYRFTIGGGADCSGHVMADTTLSLAIGRPPRFGEVLITEIMADPVPSAGLPEVEYVEIYHAGTAPFDLSGILLYNGGKGVSLGEGQLAPGEFLVLSSVADARQTVGMGRVVGLSGWVSLANAGDSLTLVSSQGEVLDRVVYHSSWYGVGGKDEGGYSLELIGGRSLCAEASGWGASSDSQGGTPGRQNSLFYHRIDTIKPELISAKIEEGRRLVLHFSEPLADSLPGFSVEGAVWSSLFTDATRRVLTLTFSTLPEAGKEYRFTIGGGADCSGHVMADTTLSLAIGRPPRFGEVLITEIMADPVPSAGLPEVEYVEIYHAGTAPFDLSGILFYNGGKGVSLGEGQLAPGEFLVLSSVADARQTVGMGRVLGLSGWVSLANAGDSLTLVSSQGEVLDRVVYHSSWYGDGGKDEGGYSLELIGGRSLCAEASGWGASSDSQGGTPGRQNSLFYHRIDTIKPELISAKIEEGRRLVLHFSEPLADSLPGFSVEGAAWSSLFTDATRRVLTLTFSTLPEVGKEYRFTIGGGADCSGHVMADTTLSLAIGRPPRFGEVLITEIMADPVPSAGLPEVEYVEIYHAGTAPFDLSGILLYNGGKGVSLGEGQLAPGEFLVLSSVADARQTVGMGRVAGLSGWVSLANAGDSLTLVSSQGEVLDRVVYHSSWYGDGGKDEGGYSLELIGGRSLCAEASGWGASSDSQGGTPGRQNSLFYHRIDTIKPELISAKIEEGRRLVLHFSEPLADSLPGFSVEGAAWSNLFTDATRRVLTLTFSTLPEVGKEYRFTIGGGADCSGHVMADTTLSLAIGRPPRFGEVLITEIMADPVPSVGLPEVEYVEIFNSSKEWISMDKMSFAVGSRKVKFPDWSFRPESHLIMGSVETQEMMKGYGATLGIASFPALLNDGDRLALYLEEELIYEVTYHDNQFAETAAKDGGRSLEMISTSLPCAGNRNWSASIAPKGGTPGQPNSIMTTLGDGQPATVIEAIPESEVIIRVLLSERVLPGHLTLQLLIKPYVPVAAVVVASGPQDFFTVHLGRPLQPNTPYSLFVSGLVDCQGNISPSQSANFVLPSAANSLDVVINEVLFDPRSGGVDFVEIYNRSAKYLNVSNWQIGNANSATGEPHDLKKVTSGSRLLAPGGFLVLTSDPATLKADYPSGREETFVTTSLPSYPNDEGSVILADSSGLIIDRLDYSEDMHNPLLSVVEGVSLERLSTELLTNDSNNWRSASGQAGFATPGYPNSGSISRSASQNIMTVEPQAFIPGSDEINGFVTVSFNHSLTNAVVNIHIYDVAGHPITTLAESQIVSEGSFFRWDGSDASGNKVRVGGLHYSG